MSEYARQRRLGRAKRQCQWLTHHRRWIYVVGAAFELASIVLVYHGFREGVDDSLGPILTGTAVTILLAPTIGARTLQRIAVIEAVNRELRARPTDDPG